ncbi:transcriptional regulator, ArsR family [Hydrogenobacter thermophilus TK-6]|uniref:Transcriptional regulator, ArsR family n=1 Tax=Hydrogenobacter thermophilus (strain DSM 6534 / IAM 12695 / TK-6) TaxID=608538 RepID=D3DK69_HYDTT|nr:metalloregulator ArsR/SmtB family transcription factor [Hydrogenobacter thermophilus]ADO46140.1 transcriptional regulator, ArsR family [Hydrogenobacter thermophilus TK-6]BAI70221.1 transcriptional regulator, ArsR family [Hydrogenobacter thermophilus TK-6]
MKEQDLLKVFYALSDSVRLGIVRSLLECEELCVCQITQAFGLSQPNASFHLRVLREANLVLWEKRGKWTYYKINHHNQVLAQLRPLIESLDTFSSLYTACEA